MNSRPGSPDRKKIQQHCRCTYRNLSLRVVVIRDYFIFALLVSVIGQENFRYPLKQSGAKLTPMANWSLAFFRALSFSPVFSLNFLWFWFFDSQLKTALHIKQLPKSFVPLENDVLVPLKER